MSDKETPISKMQKVRKRELRRAIQRLHEVSKLYAGRPNAATVYGLRVAITTLGEMRKEINRER